MLAPAAGPRPERCFPAASSIDSRPASWSSSNAAAVNSLLIDPTA